MKATGTWILAAVPAGLAKLQVLFVSMIVYADYHMVATHNQQALPGAITVM
jgi:hypothetical protein